eukprot:scaffold7991_cov860-Prasinococcus_capsulatus_cf.AAC.1
MDPVRGLRLPMEHASWLRRVRARRQGGRGGRHRLYQLGRTERAGLYAVLWLLRKQHDQPGCVGQLLPVHVRLLHG